MYQLVPEHYRAVSDGVSKILDVVGYSQRDREKKVRIATAHEVYFNLYTRLEGGTGNRYMFGSRAEGSTGPGLESDRDLLCHNETMLIVTDLLDCQLNKENFLMVQDEHTHPGYVKLQRVIMLPDNTTVPLFHIEGPYRVDVYGRSVLPDIFIHVNNHHYTVCSGPACTYKTTCKELSWDSVFTVRCKQWPSEAHEWFQRRRFYGWPSAHQIQNAWNDGCFAAHVGHPWSCEKDLEWRLSFSITERQLTRSFEDPVMKVYVLLKMVKKTYIEPRLGDAFSSYHCKVCMLWMRERIPPELWRTENILYCLIQCIKQLYEWAREGFCPDYFIIRNNIYDRKLNGTERIKLTWILGDLLSQDCRFLLGIECCNLGQLFLYDCSNLDLSLCPLSTQVCVFMEALTDIQIYLKYISLCRYNMLHCIPHEYRILTGMIRRLLHALQYAPRKLRKHLYHILGILFSRLGFYFASVCKTNADSLSQDAVDFLLTLASRCLSLGINTDATSVRLKVCGLGIEFGNYNQTETYLQHISERMRDVLFVVDINSDWRIPIRDATFIERNILRHRYSLEELLPKQISFDVVYLPSEIFITPTTLRMEMFGAVGESARMRDENTRVWYNCAAVDPFICLYFFQYLNFGNKGMKRHQQAAIDNMIHLIRTVPNILHRGTALNILGYCFMREAHFSKAFNFFYESLQIRPHHNSAKFYLGILFHQVTVTRRRLK